MWTLWIVSSVIGSEEPTYTRSEPFETAMSCHIEQAVLETTFTEGEKVVCINE